MALFTDCFYRNLLLPTEILDLLLELLNYFYLDAFTFARSGFEYRSVLGLDSLLYVGVPRAV